MVGEGGEFSARGGVGPRGRPERISKEGPRESTGQGGHGQDTDGESGSPIGTGELPKLSTTWSTWGFREITSAKV